MRMARALLSGLVIAMAAFGLIAPVSAQVPLTGGLPDVAARVTALEALVRGLQASNSALQAALAAETANRQAADSALQAALAAEAASRQAGNSALQAALNQESSTRASQEDA